MTSSRPRTARLAGGLLIATATLLAGCSDDDDASADYAAFCEAELAVEKATMSEDPAVVEGAFEALVAATPEDERAIVERTIAEAKAFMEADMPPSPEFNEAYGELISVVKAECGYEELDAGAVDYAYTGIDDELPPGPTVITFDNEGTEFHEMIVVKRREGVDMPTADLLQLDQDEASEMVDDVGGAFAAPGTTAYTVVDLEPGNYIFVCFLPQGATQEAWDAMMAGGPEPDGPMHAELGMYADFEVTS
jgi:hypothetical protein